MQAQKQMHTSHLLKNGNKKLALLIKIKLDNIRLNCHKITINEKEAPTIKAVDRPDQWTTIATSSRHRQSNSIVKRNVKLWSPKCQLNFIASTKILANQTQIQTKTQPETISHPKHIVQTRDNGNISKSIKKKDTKQEKFHKTPIANPPKKKLEAKCPLTNKQQSNTLLTTQIHLQTTSIHKDVCNKRNTSSIKVPQPIGERSKPSIDKTSKQVSGIYYGNHSSFFNVFLSHVIFEFQTFHIIFLTNISGYMSKPVISSIFYVSHISFRNF